MKRILQHPLVIKIFNWEYWPFDVVYAPLYFYWLLMGLRARAVFFFNTANPTIKNGGFLMESKKEIYDIIPPEYYPATLLFEPSALQQHIVYEVYKAKLQFPLIAKPDIGMRGISVEKVITMEALLNYAAGSKVPFLVQQFIPFENEAGIFYYRYPNQKSGHISGIVGKEFLTVTGNGLLTVQQLLQQDARYILQLKTLQKTQPALLEEVLAKKETRLLVPYGNHSRGAKFIDITYLTDETLTNTIDGICKQVPGFFYGRMDIRYNTWEELRQGKNFSIIELNGAGSEPTHMYDPRHSIFFAWKEIIRHWEILLKISRQNHQLLKMPYMKFKPGMQMLKENSAYVKLISSQFEKKALDGKESPVKLIDGALV